MTHQISNRSGAAGFQRDAVDLSPFLGGERPMLDSGALEGGFGMARESAARPARGDRAPGLLGRRREREALDRLLVEARAGRGGTLVVRGEQGVGGACAGW